jgi:hypothetical protein
MALSLSRNAKFYCSYIAAGTSTWDGAGTHPGDADTFEIPVLDGFSFSQATGTQNVVLNEAGDTPKRGQKIFNTSLEAVEWSFTTYIRPFVDSADSSKHSMTEKLLWNALVSNSQTNNTSTGGIVANTTDCTVDFEDSEHNQLLKFTGWFVFTDGANIQAYELAKMCVNTASIDFDIDGIAQITWSGYATSVTEVGASAGAYPDQSGDATDGYVPANSDADFILNRLSTVTLTSTISGGSKAYTFPLTGGNVTVDNGITYVIPEELGKINTPVDHQVGTRAISGNFTAYLDTTALSTKVMYDDILADINGAAPDVTNVFSIDLKIGGASAPFVQFNMLKAHLELPAIDTADVMGVTINFTALESAFGGEDELTVKYKGLTST